MAFLSFAAGCKDSAGATGGGGGAGGGDGGVECDPGEQDEDDDGICLPDCSAVICEHGECAITAGVAACECEPGFGGDTCDEPDAPAASSVAFWIDAADETTVSVTGGYLTNWTDKSANALTSLTDADDAAKPTVVDDALNGLPVVRFDGEGDYVSWADLEALTNETAYTIVMVVSAGLNDVTFLEGTSGANRLAVHTGTGSIAFEHDPGVESAIESADGWSQPAAHIVTLQRTSSKMSIWIDGRHRHDGPTADGNALNENLTLVAGLGEAASSDLIGDIAEVLIFDSGLDYEGRRAIEAYLGAKWFGAAPDVDPTAIGVTSLWLDASQASSFTMASGAIAGWENLGNAGGSFTQGTTAEARPTVVDGGLNGLDVVRFDGDDVMAMNDYEWFGGTVYNFYAVLVPPATGGAMTVFNARYMDDTSLQLDILPTAGLAEFIHRAPAADTGGDVIDTNLGTAGEPILVRMRRSGPSMTFTVETTATGTGTEQAIVGAMQNLLLGGELYPEPANGFAGDIAEVILMSEFLSNDEEMAIENWLRAKWGL